MLSVGASTTYPVSESDPLTAAATELLRWHGIELPAPTLPDALAELLDGPPC